VRPPAQPDPVHGEHHPVPAVPDPTRFLRHRPGDLDTSRLSDPTGEHAAPDRRRPDRRRRRSRRQQRAEDQDTGHQAVPGVGPKPGAASAEADAQAGDDQAEGGGDPGRRQREPGAEEYAGGGGRRQGDAVGIRIGIGGGWDGRARAAGPAGRDVGVRRRDAGMPFVTAVIGSNPTVLGTPVAVNGSCAVITALTTVPVAAGLCSIRGTMCKPRMTFITCIACRNGIQFKQVTTGKPVNPTVLESEIAKATKRYVQHEWHLDVRTFGRTRERAWVRLAGRILDRPGATMPAKGWRMGDRK
jgi:hypothetical protein